MIPHNILQLEKINMLKLEATVQQTDYGLWAYEHATPHLYMSYTWNIPHQMILVICQNLYGCFLKWGYPKMDGL